MTAKCVHHWIIEPFTGNRSSLGKCKHCKAIRKFSNCLPRPKYILFGEDYRIGSPVEGKFVMSNRDPDAL